MVLVVLAVGLVAGCGPIGGKDKPTKTPGAVLNDRATATKPARGATPGAAPAATPGAAAPAGTPPAAVSSTAPPSASPTGAGVLPTAPASRASPTSAGLPPTAVNPSPPRARPTTAPPSASDCKPPANLPRPSGSGTVVTTADGVNLRAGPGTTCQVIDTMSAGTSLTPKSGAVSADGLLWIEVDDNGNDGWVAAQFVKASGQ